MPKALRSPHPSKKKGRPPKKKFKDGSREDENDDLDYLAEESDHSFGMDDLDNSDGDSLQRGRKRARSKPPMTLKDEKKKTPVHPGTPTTATDGESDYDETGETKVDRTGHLLGGRQYKVPTFELPTRDNMVFMFSKDPAALLGFRDSFVFLKKNPKLVKVHITDSEKGYLVQQNLLRSTFRTREVSVVTARSVFKQFGHRVLRKGRKGRDDYFYTPEEEGDYPDENSEEETKEVAEKPVWTPFAVSNRNNLTSRKANKLTAPAINETNWMHHVALSIRNFNTQLCDYRRDNPTFFDIHTNVYQLSASRQPLKLLYDISSNHRNQRSAPKPNEEQATEAKENEPKKEPSGPPPPQPSVSMPQASMPSNPPANTSYDAAQAQPFSAQPGSAATLPPTGPSQINSHPMYFQQMAAMGSSSTALPTARFQQQMMVQQQHQQQQQQQQQQHHHLGLQNGVYASTPAMPAISMTNAPYSFMHPGTM